MWVVEPCNRPWEENEVNAYEYARDRFWKAIGGMDCGDDPDFLPVYLAHGPSQGKVNTGTSPTRSASGPTASTPTTASCCTATPAIGGACHSREAKAIEDRPAVWVIYEPEK